MFAANSTDPTLAEVARSADYAARAELLEFKAVPTKNHSVEARIEAARKIVGNRAAVVADATLAEPLTQGGLKR